MVRCPICGQKTHLYEMILAFDYPEEVCKDCAFPKRKKIKNLLSINNT